MSSEKKRKKSFFLHLFLILGTAVILACGAACCCMFSSETVKKSYVANEKTAALLLASAANGAISYSKQHAKEGETFYPTKMDDITDNIPPFVARAFSAPSRTPTPVDGYLLRFVHVPSKDDFAIEAFPATGFSGDTWVITSGMKIQKKNLMLPNATKQVLPHPGKSDAPQSTTFKEEKNSDSASQSSTLGDVWKKTQSCVAKIQDKISPSSQSPAQPPPPKDANPETAKKMLESLYRAAISYSARNGGNGKSGFPTKPTQIADGVPLVVKKAIVFLREEEDKAIPVDGYILIMYPSKTINPSDDFCFAAYPAKNFKGDIFEITKTGIVTKITTR